MVFFAKRVLKHQNLLLGQRKMWFSELDYLEEPNSLRLKSKRNCKWLLRVSTIILANATTKEGKVNFEGIGSTGAGGPAWLAVANGFFLKK
jgi:hypothetical protein